MHRIFWNSNRNKLDLHKKRPVARPHTALDALNPQCPCWARRLQPEIAGLCIHKQRIRQYLEHRRIKKSIHQSTNPSINHSFNQHKIRNIWQNPVNFRKCIVNYICKLIGQPEEEVPSPDRTALSPYSHPVLPDTLQNCSRPEKSASAQRSTQPTGRGVGRSLAPLWCNWRCMGSRLRACYRCLRPPIPNLISRSELDLSEFGSLRRCF